MDFYREADLNKFALLGALSVAAIGLSFWGLRTYARQGLEKNDIEAPWVVAARQQQGASKPIKRTLNPPAPSQQIQDAIARWRRENG